MWPWEHLAVGYILYSLWLRRRRGRADYRGSALVLAVATQLPDLVDKPLGWGTTLLATGHSVAHSLFVALPLVAVVLVATARRNRADLGCAFGIGYLSHLPGDVVYPLVVDGEASVTILLWPLYRAETGMVTDVVGRAQELFSVYLAALASPIGVLYVGLNVLLLGGALVLWIADGTPGLVECRLVASHLIGR